MVGDTLRVAIFLKIIISMSEEVFFGDSLNHVPNEIDSTLDKIEQNIGRSGKKWKN